MEKKTELLFNTIIIFLGKLSGRLVLFLLLPFYTALLDPSDYGTADILTTYVTLLAPIITLELELGAFRFLVDARDNPEKQKQIIQTAISICNKISILFIICYLIAIQFIDFPYKGWVLFDIIVAGYWGLIPQIVRGLGDNKSFAISSFICSITTAVVNIVLIKGFGFGADGILIGFAAGYLSCIIYLVFKKKLWTYLKSDKQDKNTRELLEYSIPLIPNHICWWIINAADRTIITTFLGVAVNGIYAVAIKFPSAVAGVFHTFQLSWQESTALHINDDDREEFFNDILDTNMRIFGYGGVMLIAIMPIIFNWFVRGAGYLEAYKYIPIAMLGSILNCLVSIYTGFYTALKQTKKVAVSSILIAFINLVVNFGLIKVIGIWAAFISTVVAYLVMLIYRWIDIKKLLNVSYDWQNLSMLGIFYGFATLIYYTNSTFVHIFGLLIISFCVVVINFALIRSILSKVFLKDK